MDGTLVTKEKVLTDRATAAVQKLHDAGIAFTITSGRPPLGMKAIVDTLQLTAPIAAFNGAIFLRPDFSIIEQNVLPSAIASRVIDIISAHNNEVAHWGWHQFIEGYIESLGFSFTHLRFEAFTQNLVGFGWLNQGVITNYINNARWSWIDCNDLALVAAETLLMCDRHAGKIYPLGYDAATMQEVAQILTDAVGKPFRLEAHSPEEFLEVMLKGGGDPAYMHCVYTQLKLNAANKIPCADATKPNFEAITGRKPIMWRNFA